jgi:hypothetical protein
VKNQKTQLTSIIVVMVTLLLGAGCWQVETIAKQTAKKIATPTTTPIAKQTPVYLRGAFNGWGISHVFKAISPGIYVTTIDLSAGNYGFKIAPENWSFEWLINASSSEIIKLNQLYDLSKIKGPEDYLFAPKSARYRFTLDVTQPENAKISVTELAQQKVKQNDPHKNNHNRHQCSSFLHTCGINLATKASITDTSDLPVIIAF